jgi:proline racemase
LLPSSDLATTVRHVPLAGPVRPDTDRIVHTIFCPRFQDQEAQPKQPEQEADMRVSEVIHAVDTHVCGEPGRVIVGGVLDVPGTTMFEKMVYLENHADHIRKRMLREPRGYPAANCNLILPATDPRAVAGYVIMEQVEYPGMSGTNTIAVTTVLIETGMVPSTEPITRLTLESPAGLIEVVAEVEQGKVKGVTFENVPAFAVHLDAAVQVPELGVVKVDVAYGGMFYVIADADQVGLELRPDEAGEIARVGEMIKAATQEQLEIPVHPLNPDIRGVTIGQLSAPPSAPGADRKNAVVVSTGKLDWDRPGTWKGVLDRSPCGTGTSAKMATLWAKGQLPLNQDFVHEGILGTTFRGRLIRETTVGDLAAVVPTIRGTAWITGTAQYVVDVDDPFPDGYTVGDLWSGQID